MGTSAWQQREYERQEMLRFLSNRMKRIHSWGNYSENFYSYLIEWLLLGLGGGLSSVPNEYRQRHFGQHIVAENLDSDEEAQVKGFFFETWERLDRFSRSCVERDALLAEFLSNYVLEEKLSKFRQELQRQEVSNPKTIYGVADRTVEVELTEVNLCGHPDSRERPLTAPGSKEEV